MTIHLILMMKCICASNSLGSYLLVFPGKAYGESYGVGDVLGFYIDLPATASARRAFEISKDARVCVVAVLYFPQY